MSLDERIVKRFDESQVVVLGPDQGDGHRELIGTFTGPNREANAALDAAAPDLLEACIGVIEWEASPDSTAKELTEEIAARYFKMMEKVVRAMDKVTCPRCRKWTRRVGVKEADHASVVEEAE